MNVGVRRWQVRLPAVPETVGLIRSGLRRWLVDLDWPDDAALDILLAVNEAVTNSVEHAFLTGAPSGAPAPAAGFATDTTGQGTVKVSAEVEQRGGDRRVRVRVHDNGRWLPRPGGEEYLNRRRGMPLMSAVMEQVTIHHRGVERVLPDPDAPAVDEPAVPAPAEDGAGEGTVVTLLSPPVPAPAR